jgi:nucleoid-associated protein YgaU
MLAKDRNVGCVVLPSPPPALAKVRALGQPALLDCSRGTSSNSQPVNRRIGITVRCSETEVRSMGNDTNKPDFSDMRSAMRAPAASMPPAARADFSNVQSQVSPIVDEATNYAVMAGDNLTKIAKQFYGEGNAWKRIFDANRDQLVDPDHIKAGQMLKIPAKLQAGDTQ